MQLKIAYSENTSTTAFLQVPISIIPIKYQKITSEISVTGEKITLIRALPDTHPSGDDCSTGNLSDSGKSIAERTAVFGLYRYYRRENIAIPKTNPSGIKTISQLYHCILNSFSYQMIVCKNAVKGKRTL